MDTFNLTTEISSFLGSSALVGGLIVAACLVWITWSTRSGYSLRKLSWRIVHGKSDFQDTGLKEFGDQQECLMGFRHLNGLHRIRTHRQLLRVKGWLKDNDESPSTLRKLGPAFDYDRVRVKENQTSSLGWSIVLHSVLAILVMMSFVYFTDFFRAGAVFTIVKSDNSYAVSNEGAQSWHWRWRRDEEEPTVFLAVEQCGKDLPPNLAKTFQWPVEDVQLLCQLMTDARGIKKVNNTIKGQKFFLGIFALLAVTVSFLAFKVMSRLKEYQDVEKRRNIRLEEEKMA